MACIFIEGFDKYGGLTGASGYYTQNLLLGGEWNSVAGTQSLLIVTPLSTTGFALQMVGSPNTSCSRTLAGNYGRLIGGIRFSISSLTALAASVVIVGFADAGTYQCSVTIDSGGHILFKNGVINSATTIATSTISITAASTHYIEYDITFSATGAYQLWLDGVSIMSGTGNTKTTANNYANMFVLAVGNVVASATFDDIYLFDSTGTRNNAPILTSPRVETTFPVSDNTVQFSVGASIIGNSTAKGNTFNMLANTLYLRPITPSRSGTLNNISTTPAQSSGSLNIRPLIYADSAGAPGTLMSTGATVVGISSGVAVTMPLTTPQALTAGTQYWLGFMTDTSLNPNGWFGGDTLGLGRIASVTFTSGAPSTAPAMTTGQQTLCIWGNYTLAVPVNYFEVNLQPPQIPNYSVSYVLDTVVGHEDLYNFSALTTTPSQIYCVATKAYMSKSDTGARTASVHLKSGVTEVAGTSVAPPTTFSWTGLYNDVDPATSAPWTISGVNNALGGYRIDS